MQAGHPAFKSQTWFYLFIYIVWESVAVMKKINFEILTVLHVCGIREYEKKIIFIMPSVCMSVSTSIYIYVHLTSNWWVVQFYSYSLFKSSSNIGGFSMNMNILAWKKYWLFIGAISNKIAIFSKMAETILIKFH